MSGRESKETARVRQNIREIRERLGVTQTELGGRLDCTQAQISALELGAVNLSVDWLIWIAKALGVEVEELMDLSEKKGEGGKSERGGKGTRTKGTKRT